jgi:hypothetical protein
MKKKICNLSESVLVRTAGIDAVITPEKLSECGFGSLLAFRSEGIWCLNLSANDFKVLGI